MAEHNEPSDKMYIGIAVTLGVLTAVSYLADLMHMARSALVMVVLCVAVVKATLVASFFMHLKVDWTKVKVMIIPALVLAVVLVLALLPDITLAMREKAGPGPPAPAAGHAEGVTAGH
jgi:cytochrome c oxidase subunit 4